MGEAERAYEKALAYLERRDRTEKEIRDRLAGAGFPEDIACATLGRLKDAGLVDDEGYAARYLEALAGKGRGRLRIAEEMRRKGLPDALVRNALEDGISDEDERARAAEAARLAWAGIPGGTDRRKAAARVSRRLITLGFAYETIGAVMGEARDMEATGADMGEARLLGEDE